MGTGESGQAAGGVETLGPAQALREEGSSEAGALSPGGSPLPSSGPAKGRKLGAAGGGRGSGHGHREGQEGPSLAIWKSGHEM